MIIIVLAGAVVLVGRRGARFGLGLRSLFAFLVGDGVDEALLLWNHVVRTAQRQRRATCAKQKLRERIGGEAEQTHLPSSITSPTTNLARICVWPDMCVYGSVIQTHSNTRNKARCTIDFGAKTRTDIDIGHSYASFDQ